MSGFILEQRSPLSPTKLLFPYKNLSNIFILGAVFIDLPLF